MHQNVIQPGPSEGDLLPQRKEIQSTIRVPWQACGTLEIDPDNSTLWEHKDIARMDVPVMDVSSVNGLQSLNCLIGPLWRDAAERHFGGVGEELEHYYFEWLRIMTEIEQPVVFPWKVPLCLINDRLPIAVGHHASGAGATVKQISICQRLPCKTSNSFVLLCKPMKLSSRSFQSRSRN